MNVHFCFFTQTLELEKILDLLERKRWLLDENSPEAPFTEARKNDVVQSVLLQIPQPPLYGFEDETGRIRIRFGKRRIQTLQHFLENGEFRNLQPNLKDYVKKTLHTCHIVNLKSPRETQAKIWQVLDSLMTGEHT